MGRILISVSQVKALSRASELPTTTKTSTKKGLSIYQQSIVGENVEVGPLTYKLASKPHEYHGYKYLWIR